MVVDAKRVTLVAVILLCAAGRTAAASVSVEIRSVEASDGRIEAVEVVGLGSDRVAAMESATDKEWQRFFGVYVGAEDPATESRPAILGSYSVREESVRFLPRFPFASGLTYYVRFDLAGFGERADSLGGMLVRVFRTPEATTRATTFVSAVYPSAEVWPENTLRFYVHFTAPMKRGSGHRYVYVIDDLSGERIEQAFVDVPQELWNPPATRLTVFFHPGRIKRGLVMNEEVGPPMRAGRNYTIVVDAGMLDANGQPLTAAYRKTIKTSEADREVPDPERWTIEVPKAGTRDPLQVVFDEPLDSALLNRFLAVVGSDEQRVTGRVDVGDDQRSWRLTPAAKWPAGLHVLVVDRRLEDPSGNSLIRPFELEGQATAVAPAGEPRLRLRFEVE